MWAAVLLYSATRSSYVAVCERDDVERQPGVLDEAEGPLSVAAPWRIACVAERPTKEGAEAVAAAVSKCGGFRARFRACDALRLAVPSRDAPSAAAVVDALSSIDLGAPPAADALDGMTYAWVDVRHPDKDQFVRVRTLVDTGSTDLCENQIVAARLATAGS
jgi:hypothetical protein